MYEIKSLLSVMVEHEASDIYLTVESPPMYRINGVVRPAGTKLLTSEDTIKLAKATATEKQWREFEERNEQNLALYFEELGRFRVNIFRQRGCVGLVIRRIIINIKTLDDLEMPTVMKELAMTKRGLILLVGATGSGKSTTLAAMVDHRNTHSTGHIVTIEDPIEFVHNHKKSIVTQREIGVDTESYLMALKSALRQAPDVILIGEIRDTESMDAAINIAETGHLCLGTLHCNNANQAMERILNFFPHERHSQIYMQLGMNLRGVISQRLVKRIDGGRSPAIEILIDSPYVKDLITKGKIGDLKDAMEKGSTIGMQTFDESLYDLYKTGKIDLEEAVKNADSQNNLRLKIKLAEDGKQLGEKSLRRTIQDKNTGLKLE